MSEKAEAPAVVEVDWRSPERADANEVARELAACRDRYHRWYASAYDKTPQDSVFADEEFVRDHRERILAGAEDKPAERVS